MPNTRQRRERLMKFVSDTGRCSKTLSSVLPWLLVAGCSGAVGNNGGPSGMTGAGGGNVGAGGSGAGGITMVDPNAPISGMPAVSSRLVRLNSKQWENSVQDLLHLAMPLGYSSAFVKESLETSFDTNGSILEIDTNQ